MFSSLNTQVSTKFQNARRQSAVGNNKNDVATSTSQWNRIKATPVRPVRPGPMRKAGVVTAPNSPLRTPTPTPVKPKRQQQRPNETKKINQTESRVERVDATAKIKPIDNAVSPLLKTRTGHAQRKGRGGGGGGGGVGGGYVFGTSILSHRRIVRPSSSAIFDYDLSQVEQHNFRHCQCRDPPMKLVPNNELELLRSGQRTTYLEQRYERTPDDKYNYPQATSWRYGWFHRKITDSL